VNPIEHGRNGKALHWKLLFRFSVRHEATSKQSVPLSNNVPISNAASKIIARLYTAVGKDSG